MEDLGALPPHVRDVQAANGTLPNGQRFNTLDKGSERFYTAQGTPARKETIAETPGADAEGAGDTDTDSQFSSVRTSISSTALGRDYPTMKSVKVSDLALPAPAAEPFVAPTIWTTFSNLFFTDNPTLPPSPPKELEEPYKPLDEFYDAMETMPRRLVTSSTQTLERASTWFKGLV